MQTVSGRSLLLTQVAEGVLLHESEFCQSNAVVVQGRAWHANFGEAPRYGMAGCAATVRALLSDAHWQDRVAKVLPPDIAEHIPLDLFGLITGLPAKTAQIPWDGPQVRDRAYVQSLRDAGVPSDPRIGPSATFDWLPTVHERQLQQLAQR